MYFYLFGFDLKLDMQCIRPWQHCGHNAQNFVNSAGILFRWKSACFAGRNLINPISLTWFGVRMDVKAFHFGFKWKKTVLQQFWNVILMLINLQNFSDFYGIMVQNVVYSKHWIVNMMHVQMLLGRVRSWAFSIPHQCQTSFFRKKKWIWFWHGICRYTFHIASLLKNGL